MHGVFWIEMNGSGKSDFGLEEPASRDRDQAKDSESKSNWSAKVTEIMRRGEEFWMVEVDFILIKATVSDHLPGF